MEGMEKRILIALLLSMLVLFVYPFLFPPPPPPPKSQTVEISPRKSEEGGAPPAAETVEVSGAVAAEEKTVTVETDLYKAVFTNRGAVIRHWELKQYWADLKKQNNIVLFDPGKIIVGAYPMAVSVSDGELNKLLQGGLFNVEGEDLHLNTGNPKGSIIFTLVDPVSGKGVRKSFTFYNETYTVDAEVTPINMGVNYTVSTGSNFGISEWSAASMGGFIGPTSLVGTKLIKDKVAKIEGSLSHEGDIKWTAIQDKYFISALIPQGKVNKVIVNTGGEQDIHSAIELSGGQKSSFMLYAGPKEYKRLKALGVGLDESISFGWFIVWG